MALCVMAFVLQVTAPSQQPASPRSAQGGGKASAPWKQIPIPPLHQFQPQQPRRFELSNGMVIFLQEDHELPLIDGVVHIRGGSRDEPANKAGLAEIHAEVWRTGGTRSKTGDQLDDLLETHGARVETSSSDDSASLAWSSLKGDFDQVFSVVLDVLTEPEFRQDKIDLAKEEAASLISRRNDDVGEIADRESTKLAYGADSPYARTPEYDTVAAVTHEDLLRWHRRTATPNNMIVGVTGDFDSAAMEQKLRQAFAGLPRGEPFPKTQLTFRQPPPGVYLVEKEDINQSDITLVELGTDRRNPDYYAIAVMNELFGGGYASRLYSNIRSKQGLAYDVGGGVGASFDHPGVVRISMGTKSGSTAKAIDELKVQINDLLKEGVTGAEVSRAKDTILNSFVFLFDSKERVLAEQMRYEFYGYPPDSLERFRSAIERVTPADVERVARKYLRPERLSILVVGREKDFDRSLATFGKVTRVDISIPKGQLATGQ
jgi:zinc protease